MFEHDFYTAKDFTRLDLAQRNSLAVDVVENGKRICKKCDETGEKLNGYCKGKFDDLSFY